MKRLTGSRVANALVILAIMILPLMYGGLFTSAYQDPTNRLDTMTAAVVNEDTPADITLTTGEKRHFALGDELTDRLTNPGPDDEVGFTWVEMNAKDAARAIKDEKIRAILTIPAGFSEDATRIATDDFTDGAQQRIELVTDDGVNYLAGTLSRTVAVAIENELTATGVDEYVDNVLVSLGTIRSGMTEAADGAATAQSGSATLTDGLSDLKDGTQQAVDGTKQLSDGAGQLVDGAGQVADGAVSARDGSQTLTTALGKLADGSATASTGATDLAAAMERIANGTADAHDGAVALAAGIAKVGGGATTFIDGISALDDGARQLSDGITTYTDGVGQAADGASQIAAGAQGLTTLSSGVTAYTGAVDQLRTAVVSGNGQTPSLIDGMGQLADGLGAADAQGDPTNPQANTTLVAGTDALAKALGQLDSTVNDPTAGEQLQKLTAGTSKLSQGLQTQATALKQAQNACSPQGNAQMCQFLLGALVASEDQLTDGAAQIDAGVGQIATQMGTLGSSATQLHTSAQTLADSTRQAAAGAQQLRQAVGTAQDQANPADPAHATIAGALNTLSAQSQALRDGATKSTDLIGATQKLNGGLSTLKDNTPNLLAGATKLTDGTGKLKAGTGPLVDGVQQLSDGANDLESGLGTLADGTSQARDGAVKLRDGVWQIADGSGQAEAGSMTLTVGLRQLADGAVQLDDGAVKLNDGITTLADGATQLNDGAADAQSGSAKLTDGLTTLADGLQSGSDKIPNYSDADSNHIANVISDPVSVEAVRDNAVANNGAGFTPMFMSLSLWIGAIAMFLVVPALDRRSGPLEKWWKAALRPAATGTLFGILQAIVLMVGTNWIAELHVAHLGGLILMAIASSLTFMAVNQACIALFAYRGRFVSILLLCLQITSMGATFPVETAPKFFQWIHPFLPMSYTQLAFRDMIAGAGATDAIMRCLAMLALWFIVAVCLVLLGARLRKGRRPLPKDHALLGDSLEDAARADHASATVRNNMA